MSGDIPVALRRLVVERAGGKTVKILQLNDEQRIEERERLIALGMY